MYIQLKGRDNGLVKQVKYGFSWTTLIFGCFPALFRGDLKWAAIMVIGSLFTFGLTWLIFPFFYNKMYIKELIEKGYVPSDEISKTYLVKKGMLFSN